MGDAVQNVRTYDACCQLCRCACAATFLGGNIKFCALLILSLCHKTLTSCVMEVVFGT